MRSDRTLLFVYGTLMRGESGHSLLGRDARFQGAATTEPRFTLVDLGDYPALLDGGDSAVHGELYEIDTARLPELDTYEEAPAVYERKPIALAAPATTRVAMTYVLRPQAGASAPVIASGAWRSRPPLR